MSSLPFDATITLGDHHLLAAGLDPQRRPTTIVDAVRSAVQCMDGALICPGWVTFYPRGSSARPPDTPPRHNLLRRVEEMVGAALVAAATPF